MKSKGLFSIFGLKDLKRNKFTLILLSLSVFITMSISFILPLLKADKEQFAETMINKTDRADLLIVKNYDSSEFQKEYSELEKNFDIVETIKTRPVYLENASNRFMIYQLSGYDKIKSNEIIMSRSLAEKYDYKIGDNVNILNEKKEYKLKGIEDLPLDVYGDARVTGYIKTGESEKMHHMSSEMILLKTKDADGMKSKFERVEPGFIYKTFDEREMDIYKNIDQQIMALTLISSIGYLLTIGILISAIYVIVERNKKDISSLLLIPIKRKDIAKLIKRELSIVVLIPMILALFISIPVEQWMITNEGMYSAGFMKQLVIVIPFIFFNIIVFLFWRHQTLYYINMIDPLNILNGDSIRVILSKRRKLILLVSPLFVLMAYGLILNSQMAISSGIAIYMLLGFFVIVLYILISLILKFPFWKKSNIGIYTKASIKKNKLMYIGSILNIAILLIFMFAGFGLDHSLKTTVETNFKENLPYNYMMRGNDEKLEKVLKSDDITKFTKMYFTDGWVQNKEIDNKSIRLNEIDVSEYQNPFKMVSGESLQVSDKNQILITSDYAKAYGLQIGDSLDIVVGKDIQKYKIKGTYHSSGLNNTWFLTNKNDSSKDSIYLVKTDDTSIIKKLTDVSIADVNIVSDYLYSQVNAFLSGFRSICYLFMFSAIIFNLNILYIMCDMNKKDYMLLKIISTKGLVEKHLRVTCITSLIVSFIIALIVHSIISMMVSSLFSQNQVMLDISILFAGVAFLFIIGTLNIMISKRKISNSKLEYRM